MHIPALCHHEARISKAVNLVSNSYTLHHLHKLIYQFSLSIDAALLKIQRRHLRHTQPQRRVYAHPPRLPSHREIPESTNIMAGPGAGSQRTRAVEATSVDGTRLEIACADRRAYVDGLCGACSDVANVLYVGCDG